MWRICGRPSGTLLASATFTNESASGWQQVNFSNPVPITAGTTYVASYHTRWQLLGGSVIILLRRILTGH